MLKDPCSPEINFTFVIMYYRLYELLASSANTVLRIFPYMFMEDSEL